MIDFSNVSFNSVLGKVIRLPLYLIPSSTILPILQGKLRGKRWIKGSSINGCWLGTYELDKQVLFTKELKPEMVVYDIGANVGYYTLLASTLVTNEGKVYSFEPFPENVAYLNKHLELNKISNVSVIEKAISNQNGKLKFEIGENNSVGKISDTGTIVVETISIDDFIKQGYPKPDVIKMDIEGAEYVALTGAHHLLKSNKPIIFLATHSPELRTNCLNLLFEYGYRITCIGNKPLDESDEFICR